MKKLFLIILPATLTFSFCTKDKAPTPEQEPTIFLSGMIRESASANAVATIWENGIPHSLTDGVNEAEVSGVLVAGEDVYACGFENKPGTVMSTAKLWRNGIA